MPCYVEKDGALYVLRAGKGCGFVFVADAKISFFCKSGFFAERDIDNFGGPATLRLNVVIEDNQPKIDKLEIIEG